MSELAAVLDEMKRRGLLDRASYLKVGDVEMQLGPPSMLPDEAKDTDEISTREDEANEFKRSMYGASHGWTPGVDS